MTIDEIRALSPTQRDQAVAEHVLGWTRLGATIVGTDDTKRIDDAWLLKRPTGESQLIPVSQTPAFGDRASSVIVADAMLRRGYLMLLGQPSAKEWSAAFSKAQPFDTQVIEASGQDAMANAALLAVTGK